MAQLDSDAIKSNFSKKNHSLLGSPGSDRPWTPWIQTCCWRISKSKSFISKSKSGNFFCLASHQDPVTVVDGCTLATQFHGKFTYYLKGILILFFCSLIIGPNDWSLAQNPLEVGQTSDQSFRWFWFLTLLDNQDSQNTQGGWFWP